MSNVYPTPSLLGAGAGTTDGAAVIRVLKSIKNYPGVTGPITFLLSGDRKQIQYVLSTVRNGQFVRATM